MSSGSTRKKLADGIDTVIDLFRWPYAAVAVAATIPAGGAFLQLIRDIFQEESGLLWQMVAGVAGYVVIWWALLRHTKISFFSTLEHELTHALFALLTLHTVTGLRASLRGGGQMTFRGKGNWIITLSPYFFPTAAVLTTVVLMLLPEPFASRAAVLFGVSVGYHVVSTYHETHWNQSDFRKAGLVFTVLILPFTYIFLLGLCISGYAIGAQGCLEYLVEIGQRTRALWS